MGDLEMQSGMACVLLGLSSGGAASSSHDESPTFHDPKAAASGSAIRSYTLQSATKKQTQAAALPRKEWSPHEDELIRRGVEQLGCRWRVIAAQLPGRSDDAVRNRWSRLQDTVKGRAGGRDGGSRRGANAGAGAGDGAGVGSEEQGGRGVGGSGGRSDGEASEAGSPRLLPSSPRHGGRGGSSGRSSGKSGLVGAGSGKATASSGGGGGGGGGGSSGAFRKERSSWTRAEDDIIVQGVTELGHKWFEIARRLPGRTDHAIRNRWSRLQSILLQQDAQHFGASSEVGHATCRSPGASPLSLSAAGMAAGSMPGFSAPPAYLPPPGAGGYGGLSPHEAMGHLPSHLHHLGPALVSRISSEELALPTATAELTPPEGPPENPESPCSCDAVIALSSVATLDATTLEMPPGADCAAPAEIEQQQLHYLQQFQPQYGHPPQLPPPPLLSAHMSPSTTATESSPVAGWSEAPGAQPLGLLLALNGPLTGALAGAAGNVGPAGVGGGEFVPPAARGVNLDHGALLLGVSNQASCEPTAAPQDEPSVMPPAAAVASNGQGAAAAALPAAASNGQHGPGASSSRDHCATASAGAAELQHDASGHEPAEPGASGPSVSSVAAQDAAPSANGRPDAGAPEAPAPSRGKGGEEANAAVGGRASASASASATLAEGSAELLLLRKRARVTA